MSENNRARWFAEVGARADSRLSELLRRLSAPAPLREAMEYAALSGGKRLRPAILLAVAEDDSAAALDAACALECIHCYSLAHDDLPCMDDASTRRGKPSCHAKYGEATALLAGDCLHSLAFEILADCGLPPAAFRVLARAAGGEGMGGGQAADLRADAADESALRQMHEMKTGALFDAAAQLGLLCRAAADSDADADKYENESRRLREFALAFGRLFQIANDIKDSAADSALGKKTYCTVLGETGAITAARAARDDAIRALALENDGGGGGYPRLGELTETVWQGVR